MNNGAVPHINLDNIPMPNALGKCYMKYLIPEFIENQTLSFAIYTCVDVSINQINLKKILLNVITFYPLQVYILTE